MMNLKPFSIVHKQALKWISYGFILASFIGFLDATFLAVLHYRGVPPPCSILKGCEIVTTSRYAAIGPVSVALLGSLYYLAIFLLALAYVDTGRQKILKLLFWLAVIGFLASIWFVFLQLFIIRAICLYCLVSAGTSTILFVLTYVLNPRIDKTFSVRRLP